MIKIRSLKDILEYVNDYEAFIFDLDDTLYSEKEYVRSGYKKIASAFPDIPNLEEKLLKAFKEGKHAIDYVLENEGIQGEKAEKLKAEWLSIYRNQAPDIHLYKDALHVLNELKESGKYLGLITDGRPEGQRAKIKSLGIEPYFNKIIITDELGGPEYRKPCSRAFEEMQSAAGIPYKKMVYIGDNTQKDFFAPTRLGMGSIWFENKEGIYSKN